MMSNAPTIHIFKKSKKAAGERIHYPSSPESWDINQSPKEPPNHPSYDPGTTMSSPRKLQGASTRLADVVCACWGMFHAAWALEGNYHRSLDMLGSSFQSILSTLKLSRVPIANNLCF